MIFLVIISVLISWVSNGGKTQIKIGKTAKWSGHMMANIFFSAVSATKIGDHHFALSGLLEDSESTPNLFLRFLNKDSFLSKMSAANR